MYELRRRMQMNQRGGVERIRRCQNQSPVSLWDKYGNDLFMPVWHPAYSWRDLNLGFCKERVKLSSRCEGKTSSRRTFKKESTDAWHGGRNSRSSEEVPVMGMERSLLTNGNLLTKLGGKDENEKNVYEIAGTEKEDIHQSEG